LQLVEHAARERRQLHRFYPRQAFAFEAAVPSSIALRLMVGAAAFAGEDVSAFVQPERELTRARDRRYDDPTSVPGRLGAGALRLQRVHRFLTRLDVVLLADDRGGRGHRRYVAALGPLQQRRQTFGPFSLETLPARRLAFTLFALRDSGVVPAIRRHQA